MVEYPRVLVGHASTHRKHPTQLRALTGVKGEGKRRKRISLNNHTPVF